MANGAHPRQPGRIFGPTVPVYQRRRRRREAEGGLPTPPLRDIFQAASASQNAMLNRLIQPALPTLEIDAVHTAVSLRQKEAQRSIRLSWPLAQREREAILIRSMLLSQKGNHRYPRRDHQVNGVRMRPINDHHRAGTKPETSSVCW